LRRNGHENQNGLNARYQNAAEMIYRGRSSTHGKRSDVNVQDFSSHD